MPFQSRIRPFVDAELAQAHRMREAQDFDAEFRHLERAHVLGQASTIEHVRIHALMFAWARRHRKPRELLGQALRIIGAATKTIFGLVPIGNTGGSDVSPFRRMPIPADLQRILDSAR